MGRIEVTPSTLRDVGVLAQQAGTHVTGLAGSALGLAHGDGAPTATASALHAFGSNWSGGMARLGEGIHALGTTTDLAAGLYEQTDAQVMPDR